MAPARQLPRFVTRSTWPSRPSTTGNARARPSGPSPNRPRQTPSPQEATHSAPGQQLKHAATSAPNLNRPGGRLHCARTKHRRIPVARGVEIEQDVLGSRRNPARQGSRASPLTITIIRLLPWILPRGTPSCLDDRSLRPLFDQRCRCY